VANPEKKFQRAKSFAGILIKTAAEDKFKRGEYKNGEI
jgi:hypothetical protein